MALGRTLRRAVLLGIVVGGGGFAAAHPGAVRSLYEDIYPSDPGKRQALELCFMQDHTFNRLDAVARDNCYRHMMLAVGEASNGGAAARPEANPIDLTRAAGEGSMPRNDIRRLEQTRDATRPSR
ncbi:MAG TPA: hypothetical protein VMB84_16875 [Stellaceae bacterium]|nr:hypothetical protein [Stellaceae bacterium]